MARCEGCGARATREDSDSVPLCQKCFDACPSEGTTHSESVEQARAISEGDPHAYDAMDFGPQASEKARELVKQEIIFPTQTLSRVSAAAIANAVQAAVAYDVHPTGKREQERDETRNELEGHVADIERERDEWKAAHREVVDKASALAESALSQLAADTERIAAMQKVVDAAGQTLDCFAIGGGLVSPVANVGPPILKLADALDSLSQPTEDAGT